MDTTQLMLLALGAAAGGVVLLGVYGILLATGFWIYGNTLPALILTIVSVVSAFKLKNAWGKLVAISPEIEMEKE
jgi:fructose-1,6-bisphosphatase